MAHIYKMKALSYNNFNNNNSHHFIYRLCRPSSSFGKE